MRIQHYTVEYQYTECAECAYPFDVHDEAYIVKGDDEHTYCSVNCATRHQCDISLREYEAEQMNRSDATIGGVA